MRLYHGGIPGLLPGQTITPGHDRRTHVGCPWCQARAAGLTGPGGIDGPSQRPDRVYATTHRLYAAYYASLYGRGDLYRVDPLGPVEQSTEDSFETYTAAAFTVRAAIKRAVLLADTERRRLWREWTAADLEAASGLPDTEGVVP